MTRAQDLAEIVRSHGLRRLLAQDSWERPHVELADAALNELATLADRAEEELRIREHSQIPVIPRAALDRMNRAEADLERARKALRQIAKRDLFTRTAAIARAALGDES